MLTSKCMCVQSLLVIQLQNSCPLFEIIFEDCIGNKIQANVVYFYYKMSI